MQLPKYEGRITVPSGGWSVEVDETFGGGGTETVVFAGAGDYYLGDLVAQLATALNASPLTFTYTTSVDDDTSSATGRVTIAATGGTPGPLFTFAWGETEARDALGFTGDFASLGTTQSTNASPWIWLPDKPRAESLAPNGYDLTVVDGTTTVAPSGVRYRAQFAKRYYNAFSHVHLLRRKTFTGHESIVNESLETWWNTVIAPGYPWRYFADRSVDATYLNYFAVGEFSERFAPQRSVNAFMDDFWSIGWQAARYVG